MLKWSPNDEESRQFFTLALHQNKKTITPASTFFLFLLLRSNFLPTCPGGLLEGASFRLRGIVPLCDALLQRFALLRSPLRPLSLPPSSPSCRACSARLCRQIQSHRGLHRNAGRPTRDTVLHLDAPFSDRQSGRRGRMRGDLGAEEFWFCNRDDLPGGKTYFLQEFDTDNTA